MPYEAPKYVAAIDEPAPDTACECGDGCGWKGPYSALTDIEDCMLTPGDASPAGRCPDPECNSLAYIKPEAPAAKRQPADPDDMNEMRAEWAKDALAAFSERTGCGPDEALGDLLCNFMHYADREGFDFADKVENARNVYAEETRAPFAPMQEIAPATPAGNPYITALELAEGFISGFEDDETQENIPWLLQTIRAAMLAPVPAPASSVALAMCIDAMTPARNGEEQQAINAAERALGMCGQ